VEDLWSFNEEMVARAIYNSKIPTISAVGHQINVTLSDLAADAFVETPSAAAKIIVDKKNALLADLDGCRYQLTSLVSEAIHGLKNNLVALRHMLKSPLDRLLEKQQLLDELGERFNHGMRNYLALACERSRSLIQRLEALSPLAVLSRGYSLSMLMPDDTIVKEAKQVKPGDAVKTILDKGGFISRVESVISDEKR
jgi:exodeoxyribonuclease VII large subunit